MRNEKKFDWKAFVSNNLVLLALILLVIVTTIVEPKFLSSANLTNVMRQMWPLPFIALGMSFVIIGGFIDLSVVGIISLSAIVAIAMIDRVGQVGAMICAVLSGGLMGWLNGLVLTTCGAMIQAEVLFITYGMSSVYMAIGLLMTNSETLRIARCTRPYTLFTALGSGTVGPIPIILIAFIVVLLLAHFFHTKTLAGRCVTLMGGNKEAAYLSGFNMKRTMRMVYTISGLMSGLGAIAFVARNTIATATCGTGQETYAILCVVVGGTSLKGGKGNVLRTMLGVVLITLLGNCMNLLGLSTYMQTVMRGLVLVVAIWLDNRKGQ